MVFFPFMKISYLIDHGGLSPTVRDKQNGLQKIATLMRDKIIVEVKLVYFLTPLSVFLSFIVKCMH